jgi:hypothetical protein
LIRAVVLAFRVSRLILPAAACQRYFRRHYGALQPTAVDSRYVSSPDAVFDARPDISRPFLFPAEAACAATPFRRELTPLVDASFMPMSAIDGCRMFADRDYRHFSWLISLRHIFDAPPFAFD